MLDGAAKLAYNHRFLPGAVLGVLLVALPLGPTATQAQDLGWSSDIGTVGTAGDGSFNAATGTYQIKGAGVGLAGSADAFHFAYYESVCGDGQMIVRLASADAGAQAALVVRESLDANAASAAASVAGGNARFVRRLATGNNTVAGAANSASTPCWLKVVRSGNIISAFVSADGLNWTSLGADAVSLSSPTIYVGLAVSNGVANATNTARATFDSLQSTFLPGEGLALWLRADAGVTRDGNGAVSAWADQSGSGMDATPPAAANRPQAVSAAMNGQPVVRFNGSGAYLKLPAGFAFTQGLTALVVARPTQAASWQMFFDLGNGAGVDNLYFSRYDASDGLIFSARNGGSGVSQVSAGGGITLNTCQLLEAVESSAAGTTTLYKNRLQLAQGSAGVLQPVTRTSNFIAEDNWGEATFQGDLAEIVLFDRPLSDSQRQAWEDYLNSKYAFAVLPPVPMQLAATALSATQIALSWNEDPAAMVTGYQLERQNADGTWSVIATLGLGTLSYTDSTVTAGVTYHYRVSALNGYGSSAPSPDIAFAADPGAGEAAQDPANPEYNWSDSDQPGGPAYVWNDISTTGTLLTNISDVDDANQQVSFSFQFPFFNTTYSSVFVCSNGFLTFGAGSSQYVHSSLPSTGMPSNLVAPYFTDLNTAISGEVYAQESNGRLTVQFNNVALVHGSDTNTYTFQAVLESTGQITYYYQTLGSPTDNATVGLQSGDNPPHGRQVAYNQAYLHNGLAVQFHNLALQAPPAPSQFVATALSSTQVMLNWTETSPYVSGYTVERQNADGTWSAVAMLPAGTTQYTVANLSPGIAYQFQVIAANQTQSSSSATASLTIPASIEALPAGDIRLWLRADTGTITDSNGLLSQWMDASGNGLSASQDGGSRPAVAANSLNTQPVVHFDGSSSFLNLPGNLTSNLMGAEVYVVLRAADPISNVQRGLWRFDDNNTSNYPWSDGNIYDTFGSNSEYGFSSGGAVLDQFNLYNVSAAATGEWVARLNGEVLRRSTNNTVRFSAGAYTLGRDRDGRLFAGDIAEVMIFDRALTGPERQAVEQYLAAKYALDSLPVVPTNLAARALSPTQVSLTWQYPPANSAVRFNVERQVGTADGYQSLGFVENATSFIDASANAGTAYKYRVEAINLSGGVSAASNETSATTPAVGTDLPVGDLCLWLKADANATATLGDWVDQSGSSNDAQQGSPGNQPTVVSNVLNGQPVVRFDGHNTVLQMPGALFQGVSSSDVFVVLRAGDPVGGDQGLWRFTDRANDFYPENNYLCATFGTQNRYAPIGAPVALDQFNLYNVSAAPDAWTARLNGEVLYTSTSNTVDFNAGAYLLGQTRDGYRWNGDIAEVMVFRHALSAPERLAVEQYLAGKYALAPAPTVPTGVSVQALSPTQTSVTWQYPLTNSGTYFTIERAVASTGNYQVIAVVANATSFLDGTAVAGTAYLYRVTSTDLAGNVSAASAAGQTSTPASGANLPTAGLQVWLRADAGTSAGALGAWLDQSGNGNHAQQGGPSQQPKVVPSVINGRPVVRFDGSRGQYLNLPDIFGANAGGVAGELVVVLRNSSAPGTNNGLGQFGTYGGTLYPGDDGSLYSDFGANTEYDEGVPAPDLTQFNIYDVSSQADLWQSWVDGVPLYRNVGSPVRFSGSPTLGYYYWDGSRYFAGDVAEVLAYNRVLTPDERQSLNAYLTQKYQLLPAPATPTGLQVIALSQTQNLVSWNEPVGNDPLVYTILRAESPGGPYTIIATVVGGSGTYLDDTAMFGQTYYYEVYVQNSAGSSGTTAAMTALNLQPVVQSLPTAGLQLWLMGDGAWESPVSYWHDYSGQGNDATQNASNAAVRPTVLPGVLNGKTVLHFDGSQGQYLNLPDVFSAATATAGEMIVVLRSTTATGTNNGLGQFGTYGGTLYPGDDGSLYSDFGANTEYDEGVPIPDDRLPAADLTQFNVYDLSSQPGLWQSWLNEVPFFQSLNNATSFVTNPTLGYYYWYGSRYFAGDVAEVLVFNRVLTPTERHALTWYLAAKYLLPNYDLTGDGLTTGQKLALGLDPFALDSNGDGLSDAVALQLGLNPAAGGGFIYTTPPNPNGSGSPPPPSDSNDHTPPVITLTAPVNAVPLP